MDDTVDRLRQAAKSCDFMALPHNAQTCRVAAAQLEQAYRVLEDVARHLGRCAMFPPDKVEQIVSESLERARTIPPLARNEFDQAVCTPERPWREGDETPVVHPLAREVGEQEDGWPGGDIVRMECPTCGARWKTELAQ